MKGSKQAEASGFTLPELITSIAIVGTLSAMALPKFTSQLNYSNQTEAAAQVSQIMNQVSAYNDEFGTPAQSWSELDRIAKIMTSQGAASGDGLNWITLQGNKYRISGTINSNNYTFRAEPGEIPPAGEDPENKYNLYACINVATGASEIKKGDGTTPATAADLNCT